MTFWMLLHTYINMSVYAYVCMCTCLCALKYIKGFSFWSHPIAPSDKQTCVSPSLPPCAVGKGHILPVPLSYPAFLHCTSLNTTAVLRAACRILDEPGRTRSVGCPLQVAPSRVMVPTRSWKYVVTADLQNWNLPMIRTRDVQMWFLHPFFYHNWCFHLILLFLEVMTLCPKRHYDIPSKCHGTNE